MWNLWLHVPCLCSRLRQRMASEPPKWVVSCQRAKKLNGEGLLLHKRSRSLTVQQCADVSDAFTNPPAVRTSVLGPNGGLRDILTSCDVSLFLPATAGLYCKSGETEANPSWLRLPCLRKSKPQTFHSHLFSGLKKQWGLIIIIIKKKVLLVRLYLFDAALSVGAGILRNVAVLRKMCFNAIQIGDGGQNCWCQLGRLFLHNMTGMLNYLRGGGGPTTMHSELIMHQTPEHRWHFGGGTTGKNKQTKKTQLYDLFLLKAQRATVDYFAPTWRRIGPRCIVDGKHPRRVEQREEPEEL